MGQSTMLRGTGQTLNKARLVFKIYRPGAGGAAVVGG